MSTATNGRQQQFVRPCRHLAAGVPVHGDDHIDVFLGTFRMDHDIDLGRRLDLDPCTLSPADLLLTKLQIYRLDEKDLRDMVTLLSDHDVRVDDAPGTINGRYVGERCARDWGLFYDVVTNLARLEQQAGAFGLDAPRLTRVGAGLARPIAEIDAAPKSLRWRLRARLGTHAA